MQYIDMHCDTLAKALAGHYSTAAKLSGTMADVERLRKAGAAAQFFAMFLPQQNCPESFGLSEMPDLNTLMLRMYEIYRATLKDCSDTIAAACCFKDLEKNRKEGKLSAFLTIENGALMQGEMENLECFYHMGVRLITLTWNDANCLGYPHSAVPQDMGRGLTAFGKDAVSYMNELGIVVDVSHLSDGGFYDVAKLAKRPFVASHSNCRALSPSTRNLTDDMIRTLADCGGVAGINFEPTFLNADMADQTSRVERMCDHVEHMIRVGGMECVGIGTDFDGIDGTFEIGDCTKMELLFDALHRRRIGDYVLEKIAFGNVERVIRESMGEVI